MERELIYEFLAKGTAFAAIALSQFVALCPVQALAAREGKFIDFPYLVYCEISGIDRAFYLSKIDQDGVAVYVSPDRQAGTITITGKANPIGTAAGSGNCSGKTLEQLRSAGQAFYLQQ
jgi:hypothetical protein